MARKVLELRRDDTCASCRVALPAGTRAEWDSAVRNTTCLDCVSFRDLADLSHTVESSSSLVLEPDPDPEPAKPTEPDPEPTDEPVSEPIDVGVAGASARREHERRKVKRNAKIEEEWGTGFVGKVAKAWAVEPQSTRAWKQGARGEERLANILTKRLGDGAVLLHDRRVPRTRGNIDHLAVASSGLWVIDAKQYKGKVERRDEGKFFTSDFRLRVGGRDRSKLIEGMQWQHDAVTKALEDVGATDVPVHLVVTFVDAEWSLIRRPMKFGDVLVVWPKTLAELIAEPGPIPSEHVPDLARLIAEKLPAQR